MSVRIVLCQCNADVHVVCPSANKAPDKPGCPNYFNPSTPPPEAMAVLTSMLPASEAREDDRPRTASPILRLRSRIFCVDSSVWEAPRVLDVGYTPAEL